MFWGLRNVKMPYRLVINKIFNVNLMDLKFNYVFTVKLTVLMSLLLLIVYMGNVNNNR